jgi:hypothetical protein
MALYGQLVSALLPPGFQDQPAFFGPHPTTESVFAFADDLGWRLQVIFHSSAIITYTPVKSRFLCRPKDKAGFFLDRNLNAMRLFFSSPFFVALKFSCIVFRPRL